MLALVSGGSGSGKSAFAESLVLRQPAAPRLYVATMRVWDAEGEARVARHRAMRADKGFTTLECPLALEEQKIQNGQTILLEDLSNLAMNEFYSLNAATAEDRIFSALTRLAEHNRLIVVTNELFSDGIPYPDETRRFLALMAALNRRLASRADQVWEVVCGIPIPYHSTEENP